MERGKIGIIRQLNLSSPPVMSVDKLNSSMGRREGMITPLSSDRRCDAVKLLQLLAQQIFQPEEIGKSLVEV